MFAKEKETLCTYVLAVSLYLAARQVLKNSPCSAIETTFLKISVNNMKSFFILLNSSLFFFFFFFLHCSVNFGEPGTQHAGIYNIDLMTGSETFLQFRLNSTPLSLKNPSVSLKSTPVSLNSSPVSLFVVSFQ